MRIFHSNENFKLLASFIPPKTEETEIGWVQKRPFPVEWNALIWIWLLCNYVKFDAPKSIKGWPCLSTLLIKLLINLFSWPFSSLFTPAKIGTVKHTTHEGEIGQEKILSISRLGIVENYSMSFYSKWWSGPKWVIH